MPDDGYVLVEMNINWFLIVISSPFIEYGSDLVVIREIFDGANELFENELERALEIGCQTIIIEPCRLGEETARWIFVGDCIAKTSIITGLGSLITGLLCPDRPLAQYSLLASSLLTNCFHVLSWQSDSCSHYRVERNQEKLNDIMAASSRFTDNISLITTSEMYPPSPTETIRGEEGERCNKLFDTKPIQQPVILCRRSNNEIRRSNLFTAAVSLIAFAFSVLRFFKTSYAKWAMVWEAHHPRPA